MKTKLGLLAILFIGLSAQAEQYCITNRVSIERLSIISAENIVRGFNESTCLQTNVVESEFDPNSPYLHGYIINNNGRFNLAPEEKWVTTTISKKTSLEFDWNGQHRIVSDITGISTNTVHLKIKQDWEEVK